MSRKLYGVLWFSLALILFWMLSQANNPAWEYCTTKAKGVPFPYRIDYCECDDRRGQSVYQPEAHAYNFLVALGVAFPALLLFRRGGSAVK